MAARLDHPRGRRKEKRIVLSVDERGHVHQGGPLYPGFAPPAPNQYANNAQALAIANMRRELRRQAREQARDLVLARDLCIGRPDLPRYYDDGGLIDVNHVPALPHRHHPRARRPHRAGQIPGHRLQLGRGALRRSRATPHLTPEIREYGIFLP
ncbi:hypothetical protein [Actinocorallia aurea]